MMTMRQRPLALTTPRRAYVLKINPSPKWRVAPTSYEYKTVLMCTDTDTLLNIMQQTCTKIMQ